MYQIVWSVRVVVILFLKIFVAVCFQWLFLIHYYFYSFRRGVQNKIDAMPSWKCVERCNNIYISLDFVGDLPDSSIVPLWTYFQEEQKMLKKYV